MSSKNRPNTRKNTDKTRFARQTAEIPALPPEKFKFPLTGRRKALLILSFLLLAAGFASLRAVETNPDNIHSYFSVISLVLGYLSLFLVFFAWKIRVFLLSEGEIPPYTGEKPRRLPPKTKKEVSKPLIASESGFFRAIPLVYGFLNAVLKRYSLYQERSLGAGGDFQPDFFLSWVFRRSGIYRIFCLSASFSFDGFFREGRFSGFPATRPFMGFSFSGCFSGFRSPEKGGKTGPFNGFFGGPGKQSPGLGASGGGLARVRSEPGKADQGLSWVVQKCRFLADFRVFENSKIFEVPKILPKIQILAVSVIPRGLLIIKIYNLY